MPERLGVLGSLCNPPHLGHVALARHAAEQLGLARVLLVPTGVPGHREAPAVPPAMRLRLAEAAAGDEPVLEASSIEVDRPGPSYMADSLELLRGPDRELVLLLGADQFATLDHWHDPDRVRALAMIAVAPRDTLPVSSGADALIEMPVVDVSSSDIRRRRAVGEPIGGRVSPAVLALIEQEGLYLEPPRVGFP